MNFKNSKFITFEGGEGSGKSTQAKLLAQYLENQGIKVCLTYEPFEPELRSILLTGEKNWHPVSETLLFFADRYEHLQNTIKPALERGEWVICDRFLDSPVAYQGYGYGLGEKFVRELYEKLFTPTSILPPQGGGREVESSQSEDTLLSPPPLGGRVREGVNPDITFILDIPVEKGIKRALARRGTEERFENMDISFHQRLREGFLEIAEKEQERCKVLDADRSIEEINEEIKGVLKS